MVAHHRVVEGRGVVHVLVYDFHSSSEIKVESRVALAALKLARIWFLQGEVRPVHLIEVSVQVGRLDLLTGFEYVNIGVFARHWLRVLSVTGMRIHTV